MPTPSQEDYLKTIWLLIQRKGYARVSDIAETLGVRSASVSKMVRRLHEDGLTAFEPYRGLNLTAKGRSRGRLLVERQRVLRAWLRTIGLPDGEELDRTVEEIEHYIHSETLVHVERLVGFIQGHPEWWSAYERAARAEPEVQRISRRLKTGVKAATMADDGNGLPSAPPGSGGEAEPGTAKTGDAGAKGPGDSSSPAHLADSQDVCGENPRRADHVEPYAPEENRESGCHGPR